MRKKALHRCLRTYEPGYLQYRFLPVKHDGFLIALRICNFCVPRNEKNNRNLKLKQENVPRAAY
jgi:hypothetical protein